MTTLHVDALEVIALSDHEWRVCDGRIDAADARRLLGYVERQGDTYELLRMSPTPGVCRHFDCLSAALEDLITPDITASRAGASGVRERRSRALMRFVG
ncbi:MAG TPA: hypothetical protein VGO99_09390 [Leifsonia sp.]|jgi:hypothetical protein|nr:hypothetical protein [Microbacteriaceae bacterium]HEV7813173.1 hypothetical protein [Leifsonia sp.]